MHYDSMRFAFAGTFSILLLTLGCRNAETNVCLDEYASAQEQVRSVSAKEPESVSASLKSVEAALEKCRAAQRHSEVDQLIRARNELSAHLGALDRRQQRKARKQPTPDEIRRMELEGDPSCPRGQAYRPQGGKEIRCTGPQLVEMDLEKARAYFEERDYRLAVDPPGTLVAERGSERFTLTYSAAIEKPPVCIVLVPAPGIPWQEALSRVSGVRPGRLGSSGSIRLAHGSVPFRVDEKTVTVRLGECE